MNTIIMKVVKQDETIKVDSQKAEGGKIDLCRIQLQEFGNQYEDTFIATMLGKTAICRFMPGQLVAVKLRFQAREYNGQMYQDVTVVEIAKL